MISELLILREWRKYVKILVEVAKAVAPYAEIYLVGGAAENRLTVLSDIDIVVVLPRNPSFEEATDLRARIWEEAEKRGLPPYAPIDLHIAGREELVRYEKHGKLLKLA